MDSENSDYIYALKCIYNAHSGDVRVLKATLIPEGGIITGSRDTTTKVWEPEGKTFKECNIFKGATTVISSLCVLPSSAQYPKGLFLVGTNDCSIYGFTPDSPDPILRLLGHSGRVCTLSYGKSGFLVSGSWDKTARVWSGQQCVLTLQGHQQAVWATDVFPMQNLILTGSADRTVRLWRGDTCEKIFTGHQDCVRGLAILSDIEFLSCSNDSTVRLWLTGGDCLQVFQSHTDYIYSISLLNYKRDFATCGEDQNIKIWRDGTCIQTFVLSSKSLWDVACLSNGDLAVGTSDGKVYVFERVPLDYFEKQSEMSNLIQGGEVHSNDTARVLEVSDLKSSIYCGEAIVTYQNQSDSMYICTYDNEAGTKVKKEVLDFQLIEDLFYKKSTQASVADSGHSSKKTDHSFEVSLGNTYYDLAFNKGENPWDVASRFVSENNLQAEHMGQIVSFIIKHTTITFTNEIYPAKAYLYYLNVNIEGLRAKLCEFCEQVPRDRYISPVEVDELMLLAHFPDVVTHDLMSSLNKVISWSDEFLFPVLDLLRLGVRCKGLRSKISSKEFMNHLLHIFMSTERSVNRVLIEKIFCNMFGFDETKEVLTLYQDKIFESVKEKFTGERSIQKAGSTLFLNFATASFKGFKLNMNSYCLAVMYILYHTVDSDAKYRMLVAVGTVCTRHPSHVKYFSFYNIEELISKLKKDTNSKIDKVTAFLCSDFNILE